ncbi:glycosyltransferase [Gillisia sp. JM1]|uniref:glycosyltransferase n=1 Tax=Gillisia sp. JM1 TaxID=1283286 RepID=UPI00041E0346|nr:glycosyltransferase [Gillisia sp. JM1]
MRVLQLIDSLRPGGAEKMAVNIANALLPHVEGSYLCCTRQEGMLINQLKPEVGYIFLNRRSSLDPKAILKLRKYIKENKIDIVHAHSTSYFLAGLLKLSGGRFKLIWHDHYGESEFLEKRKFPVLSFFSRFFTGIISVNKILKDWAVQNLKCKNVIEIKNFILEDQGSKTSKLKLKGNLTDFKIICVANLRPQKDHLNLLKAFELLDPTLKISLHLIGEDPLSNYSNSIFEAIKISPVQHKIYYYGTQQEIIPLLHQGNLGILSSRSEGLPLALLEYGMAGLPVICTNVGQCSEIIGSNGKIVEVDNPHQIANSILEYFKDPELAKLHSDNYQFEVFNKFSEAKIILQLIQFYSESK